MNLLTKIALATLKRAGYEPLVELRVIRLNEARPGVVGRRMETFATIEAGEAALARALPKPGTRLTLGLRLTLAEKLGPLEQRKPAAPLIIFDEATPELPAEVWDSRKPPPSNLEIVRQMREHRDERMNGRWPEMEIDPTPPSVELLPELCADKPETFAQTLNVGTNADGALGLIEAGVIVGDHEHDHGGPLVPVDGKYHFTCSHPGCEHKEPAQ